MAIITLMTDFGSTDHYVAAMKGVILHIAPSTTLVDVTHNVTAHNIVHGAFVLRQTLKWFPPGSIHIAVVDPGVGSQRPILAGQYDGQVVIAPDNGLITLVHQDLQLERIHAVTNSHFFHGPVSHTFHGRDIIAPVAAHVASGVTLSQLGPPAKKVEMLQLPKPQLLDPPRLTGNVVYVDHFGNLVTNITASHLKKLTRRKHDVEVYVQDESVGHVHRTYSDVPIGEYVALIGSSELLEISVHCGRALDRFTTTENLRVDVR